MTIIYSLFHHWKRRNTTKKALPPQLSLCGKMQAILELDVSRFGLNGTHFAPNTGEGKDDIRVNWRDFRYNFQK